MPILDVFRKRPDGPADYWVALAHERFQPDDLLKQAQEAERAGFDGVVCSDHLAPWWTGATAPTSSGNAWVWLGAVAHATTRATIGPAGRRSCTATTRSPPHSRSPRSGSSRRAA